MLIYYNGIRRRCHLTRSGILAPNHSPWPHLYQNGDEESFLNLTGFSPKAFEEMHDYLYPNELENMVRAVQDRSIVTTNWDSSCFIWVRQRNYQSFVSFSVALLLVAVS